MQGHGIAPAQFLQSILPDAVAVVQDGEGNASLHVLEVNPQRHAMGIPGLLIDLRPRELALSPGIVHPCSREGMEVQEMVKKAPFLSQQGLQSLAFKTAEGPGKRKLLREPLRRADQFFRRRAFKAHGYHAQIFPRLLVILIGKQQEVSVPAVVLILQEKTPGHVEKPHHAADIPSGAFQKTHCLGGNHCPIAALGKIFRIGLEARQHRLGGQILQHLLPVAHDFFSQCTAALLPPGRFIGRGLLLVFIVLGLHDNPCHVQMAHGQFQPRHHYGELIGGSLRHHEADQGLPLQGEGPAPFRFSQLCQGSIQLILNQPLRAEIAVDYLRLGATGIEDHPHPFVRQLAVIAPKKTLPVKSRKNSLIEKQGRNASLHLIDALDRKIGRNKALGIKEGFFLGSKQLYCLHIRRQYSGPNAAGFS